MLCYTRQNNPEAEALSEIHPARVTGSPTALDPLRRLGLREVEVRIQMLAARAAASAGKCTNRTSSVRSTVCNSSPQICSPGWLSSAKVPVSAMTEVRCGTGVPT